MRRPRKESFNDEAEEDDDVEVRERRGGVGGRILLFGLVHLSVFGTQRHSTLGVTMQLSVRLDGTSAERVVTSGERVAQMLVVSVPDMVVTECTHLSPTDRGHGGFGSMGA